MRSILMYATALTVMACAGEVQPVDTTASAIAYAEETDRAIEDAVAAGRSIDQNAERDYQAALVVLDRRTDAVERILARVDQQGPVARRPYVSLLARVGQDSPAAKQYLTQLALAKPTPPTTSRAGNHDERTEYERELGQAFAAATALVRRGDRAALLDVYANADVNVAAVAAASASRVGILDAEATETLYARGFGGSFQPLGQDVLTLPDVTLGPSPVSQPMVGPQ